MRRRTMLAPIRPRPIIPSCMLAPFQNGTVATLRQYLPDDGFELRQVCLRVFPNMHPQGAPVSIGEHLEVAAGLRRLDDAKGIFMSGNRQINGVVAGNLQKNSAVGTAFIGLASGVQKAWSKTEARSHTLAVADQVTYGLQLLFVDVIHLDVGQYGKIVAARQTVEMGFQITQQRGVCTNRFLERISIFFIGEQLDSILFIDRRLGRKRALLLVLGSQLAGCDLAGFNVWLIEGIDSDNRAGDGGGNSPTETFTA